MAVLQCTSLRIRFGWILLLAAALPFLAPSLRAQVSSPSRSRAAHAATNSEASDDIAITTAGGVKTQTPRDTSPQHNALRQKAIVDDTAQLLELAQQLKTAVDKSSKDQFSMTVIHTAAQIQKLAKTVEKKMRDTD
ncbi:MAG: hypothetical protein WA399_03255 [Acidobacteriaceae bacterium]|jgi:erythromycin esterase-like protein